MKTKEQLLKEKENLVKQFEEAKSVMNRIVGAISYIDSMLKEEEPKKEEPKPE